jgi:hypothetical protein
MPDPKAHSWASEQPALRKSSAPLLSVRTVLSLGAALIVFGVRTGAQDADHPEKLLLRARENVLGTVRRLPKYVCTQTVDRSRYEPANPDFATGRRHRSCDDIVAEARRTTFNRRLSSSDRLRLDVAVSLGATGMESEMYSWAGENRFSDRDLFDFVRDGAISSGSFSSMLASIFGGEAARFAYKGDSRIERKTLAEFGFEIPQEKSRYLYVFGNGATRQAPVPYSGSAFVDPVDSDLIRLVIRAAQLPPETGACELTQTLDYSRVRLDGTDFLLPKKAKASLIHTDGTEAENRIQYSACHEFRSDSRVRFEQPGADPVAAPQDEVTPAPLTLPPGLSFKVVLTNRIEMATAAAGDVIRGRLKTAIRDHSDNVLVPEGTPVTARLLKVRHFFDLRPLVAERRNIRPQQPPFVLDIKLEAFEIGGTAHSLKAKYDSGIRTLAKPTGPLAVRIDIGSVDRPESNSSDDIGTFTFWDPSLNFVVKSGLESSWITVSP